MLTEISISDFAIIDALRLGFAPHLNVFTGETGAGKSIIVDAISALLGERVTSDTVRAGRERAVIEGVFDVGHLLAPAAEEGRRQQVGQARAAGEDGASGGASADGATGGASPGGADDVGGDGGETLGDVLAEIGIEPEDGALILSREITVAGRGIARINRRAVPVSALQRVARFLVDIHGQSAHLELLRPEQHIFYLDRYAGTVEARMRVAALVAEWRATRRELERLRRDERELERRVELLRYQVDEIEAARLRPGELEELETERRRLGNAERLGTLSVTIHDALAGDADADAAGAMDLAAEAQRALHELLRLDDTLREQEGTLEQALALLQDVAATMRSYQDEVAADPERQAEVEERLDLIAKLRRKYGATIEEILAYAAAAARELDELTHREERAAELAAREEALKERIGTLAGELSRRRAEAAGRLAQAMERQLDDLNMRKARFEVRIARQPDADGVPAYFGEKRVGRGKSAERSSGEGRKGEESMEGGETERYAFTATGIDRVEFLIAPNPGEPLKPLARIASGGETSRLMLALKTILSRADVVPVLIFDEIDAGISGRSGQVVGEKLWELGRTHQVLCVTHLPQIAAMGDRHYRVAKAAAGGRTTTQVSELPQDERVIELSQMLGGASTAAARANAAELLERADHWKEAAHLAVQSA